MSDAQYAALFSGTPAPACSPPAVRTQQLGGPAGAMVFVLADDGSFHALDDALMQVTTARYDPPGALALALSEAPDPGDPSQIACTLAYVTKIGGIVVFDASGGVPQPKGQWPASGSGPTPLIGAQFVDGTVWAADVFGSAVAACPLPAPTAPVFRARLASPPTAADSLEVSSARRLALLGGSELRLLAFTPGAQVVDRWATGSEAEPGWAMFWEPATDPATQPGLIVTVGKGAAPGFTVLVGNTVDQPFIVTGPHAPAPTALISGTLSLASGSGQAGAVLTNPVIAGIGCSRLSRTRPERRCSEPGRLRRSSRRRYLRPWPSFATSKGSTTRCS